jgi:hypothetical protein
MFKNSKTQLIYCPKLKEINGRKWEGAFFIQNCGG